MVLKSRTVANVFEDNWLSRHPSPRRCIYDNGNAFLGPEFVQMLSRTNILAVPATVKKKSL